MGEEKPEEELMGKRKSSPRFDNTLTMLSIISFPLFLSFIHSLFVLLIDYDRMGISIDVKVG